MKVTDLLADLEYHDADVYAQPLYVSREGRVLRFMLKRGQGIRQHNAPSSPFYVVMLKGRGCLRTPMALKSRSAQAHFCFLIRAKTMPFKRWTKNWSSLVFCTVPGHTGERVGGEMGRQES